jgi:hypothetical protein
LNFLAAVLAFIGCVNLPAQVRINPEQLVGLTPVNPAQLSQTGGKFWILGHPLPDFPRPSLRCVPPDLLELGVPIYSLGNQRYVVDARGVDWGALQEQRQLKRTLLELERGGMSLLSGGVGMLDEMTQTDAPLYPPGSLYLQVLAVTNGVVSFGGVRVDQWHDLRDSLAAIPRGRGLAFRGLAYGNQ